jgi:hypothetical protein
MPQKGLFDSTRKNVFHESEFTVTYCMAEPKDPFLLEVDVY